MRCDGEERRSIIRRGDGVSGVRVGRPGSVGGELREFVEFLEFSLRKVKSYGFAGLKLAGLCGFVQDAVRVT
jgi:hypothetical protein